MAAPTLTNLGPDALHAFAVGAKKDFCRSEHLLVACLLEIDRRKLYTEWGSSNIGQYVETVLGFDRHTAREMMRRARALQTLPKLAEAYYGGEIVASKVREITRVAAPHTEEFWLKAAADHTTHEIELMVARTAKGELPPNPNPDGDDPPPLRTRMRLVFEARAFAVVSDALDRVREEAGSALSREEAFELMALSYLNGCNEERPGGARYRLVVHAEPANRLAWLSTSRGAVVLGDDAFGQTLCDAEILDLRVEDAADDPTRDVEAAGDGVAGADPRCPAWDAGTGDGGCPTWDVEGDDPRPTRDVAEAGGRPTRDAAETDERPTRDAAEDDTIDPWAFLESIAKGMASRDSVALLKSSIAPAIRRHVRARHQNRCAVPGCELHLWSEIHHLKWRMHGGDNDKENLIPACKRHHHMIHSGHLFVTGTPSGGLVWRDAHGRVLQGSVIQS